jgi:hypothetical protein
MRAKYYTLAYNASLEADSGSLIMKQLSSLPRAIMCLTCIQKVPGLNTEGVR